MRLLVFSIGFAFLALCHSKSFAQKSIYTSAFFKDTIPAKIDLSPFQSSVKSQCERNVCAYFSLAGQLEAAYKRKTGLTINISEEYLIQSVQAKKSDRNGNREEISITEVIEKNESLVYETEMSYQPSQFENENTSINNQQIKNTDKVILASANKSFGPSEVNTFSEFTKKFKAVRGVKSTIKSLVRDSLPLVFVYPETETNWYGANGRVSWDSALDTIKEDNYYNHFTLITGYDLDKQEFMIKNSWGTSWGNNGYGVISFSDFEKSHNYLIQINPVELIAPKFVPVPYIPVQTEKLMVRLRQQKDHSLEAMISAKIEDVGRNCVYVETILCSMSKELKILPDTANAKPIKLTKEEKEKTGKENVQTFWFKSSREKQSTIEWTKKNPLVLTFSKEQLNTSSVREKTKTNRMFIRTTLYRATDENPSIVLDRVYTEVGEKGVKEKRRKGEKK